jgi:hypothetical protein
MVGLHPSGDNSIEPAEFMESDHERQPSMDFDDDIDDFDPAELLNQPLFEDSQNTLNLSKSDFEMPSYEEPAPEPTSISEESSANSDTATGNNNSNNIQVRQQQQHVALDQQQNLIIQRQQELLQQQNIQTQMPLMPQHLFGLQQQQQQHPFTTDVQSQHQQVHLRVEEVQRQIQAVQQQIQQVQFQSSEMETQTMQFQQGNQNMQFEQFQQGMIMNPTMANNFTRSPPERSASLPIITRMGGRPSLSPMQQQQQQANVIANMAFVGSMVMPPGSLNGPLPPGSLNSSIHSAAGMAAFSQQQQQQQMDNNSTRSHSSVPANMQGMTPNNMAMMLQSQPMDGTALSLASSVHNNALNMNTAPATTMQQPSAQVTGPDGETRTLGVGEAMEKLCESMKRSAMSRSLVKQISNRSLTQQNSARNLMKQHVQQGSVRNLVKQGSARNLVKQGSARNLVKQGSARNLGVTRQLSGRNLIRANSGRSIQRTCSGRGPSQDPKHRMQPHTIGSAGTNGPLGRGLLRHSSQSALMGPRNNPRTILQIDDNLVGRF